MLIDGQKAKLMEMHIKLEQMMAELDSMLDMATTDTYLLLRSSVHHLDEADKTIWEIAG